MSAEIDALLWRLRSLAHARSYRRGHGDEVFWRAYALVQHPAWRPHAPVDPSELAEPWEEVGRTLSALHLGWRSTGGWPPGETLPEEAESWQVLGTRVLDLAPEDPALLARLRRVALQTVRSLAELPPLPAGSRAGTRDGMDVRP